MKPLWKRDWFWFVVMPTILVGITFLVGLLAHLT